MHLLIIADGDSKYGSANSLFGLVKELKDIDSSLDISIVLPMYSKKKKDYQDLGCNAFNIPYTFYYRGVSYERWKRPFSYIKHLPPYLIGRTFALEALKKHIDLSKVDIIHSNSSREDFSWIIKEKYGIPLIMHIREFGDDDYQCFSYRRHYIEKMNNYVDTFIAVSETVRQHWIKKGISSRKICKIYNGVASNSPHKTFYPRNGQQIKLVIVGALLETKGQHIALEALSKVNCEKRSLLSLDIIGDSSNTYEDYLRKKVDEYGLGDIVRFRGYISNPSEQLSEYDCGLMCSKSEAFGRVTVEYMMAGLCIIASRSGANEELLKEKVSGLLFEKENSLDLARKIEAIIDNPYLISKYGMEARKSAIEKFTTEINAQNIYNLYHSLYNTENNKK